MLGGKSADQKNNYKILPKKIETPQKIFLILTMSLQIKNTVLCFEPFVEMFEPTGDFSEYEDDGTIEILYKTVPCKNPTRESSGLWSAILWKPRSEVYLGKWIRLEYETSSCFALWWSEMIADEEDEEDDYEEVYLVQHGVDDLCGDHQHLKQFKTYSTEEGDYKTTYFQTSGGGPESGYFLRIFYPLNGFDPVDEVYAVERNWGTPFTAKKMEGNLDYNESDGTAGRCRYIDSDSTYTESQDDDQDKCEVCGDDSDVTVEDYAGFNMLVCPKCK